MYTVGNNTKNALHTLNRYFQITVKRAAKQCYMK